MSALLYYVAIVVSTFIVPLADVGHYCELNSHMTGLIYVLLTDRRSKLRISLSIRLASEIIILLASSASERSERAQSLFMSIEISDICIYAPYVRTSTSMRMPKKSLLRNGLSNNYRLTVAAAQLSRAPVVSLELRTKKRSTAGH